MKKITNIALCIFFLAGFSSCLKDNTIIGPDSPGAVKHVIEFLNPATITSNIGTSVPLYVVSYDLKPSAELEVMVSYSGGGGAPSDITVKVVVDNAAIDIVNEQEELDLIPLPNSVYTASSMDVVIPKGQKTGSIKFALKPDQFDLGEAYALGLKIVSVSGTDAPLSGNFYRMVINIGAKNQYDGVYNYRSAKDQSLNGGANQNGAELTTTGANTVSTHLVNTYSNITRYAIDPVTNKVTVTDSGGIGAATTDPSSNWDPVKKILYVKWNTSNRKFEETYTRIGDRG